MNRTWIRTSALGLSVLALATSPALARPDAATKPAAHPEGKMEKMDPMTEAWMKAGTPGPEHKKLAEMVGKWDAVVTNIMAPGAPPESSKATSVYTMIDGKYLHEDVNGQMMAMPFHGTGVTGYNNVTKKYESTWMDSMGTGIMMSTGTAAADGTITMTGESADPLTGKMQTFRMVIKDRGPAKQLFEMYGPGPDGKEFKTMEIAYTRSK